MVKKSPLRRSWAFSAIHSHAHGSMILPPRQPRLLARLPRWQLIFFNTKAYWLFLDFQFVASPRSQFVLNEIIYYQWEDWQDKSWVLKCLWFVVQLLLIAVCTIFYIPFRIFKEMQCSKCSEINWCIESLYEHPYSKLINHTMSYIVFVGLLFAATFGFEDEYGSSTTGLSRVGKLVLFTLAWSCLSLKQGRINCGSNQDGD